MTQPPPAATPRRLKELIPVEVAAILQEDPRLIVPVGTCEQHGPHLPLGCDTIIVERLADDLSAEFGVLRAPTVEYGVNVEAEQGFIGNGSVRKKTLHRMLNDLLASWESSGIREFILLTAHGHDEPRILAQDRRDLDGNELLETTRRCRGGRLGHFGIS